MPVSVAVLGATGYTGGELIRLLSRHKEVELTYLSSSRFAGRRIREVFPALRGATGCPGGGYPGEIVCQPMDVDAIAASSELVFCALPHVTSMEIVPRLLDRGCRVIDLSADFRLRSGAVYEEWYGHPHTATDWLAQAVYGLPELYREEIKKARLVANPGCYPTSVILALAPLARDHLISLSAGIIVDSKSGTSGAGRTATQELLFAEVMEGFRAYKTGGHRHTPEIEQEISRLTGESTHVRFVPHLLPQARGILSTCYVRPHAPPPGEQGWQERDWWHRFEEFYRDEPFVVVLPPGEEPSTSHVRGSNQCRVMVRLDVRTGWLTVFSALDNLVKGASGQAVQNMNLMLGFTETEGLTNIPVFP
jgi:N-acetyl-gamma-glutamyl-phosphate reductase